MIRYVPREVLVPELTWLPDAPTWPYALELAEERLVGIARAWLAAGVPVDVVRAGLDDARAELAGRARGEGGRA